MIITIASLKGGSAKTSTAVHLAWLASGGGKTLLIDADPQGSASDWAAAREAPAPFAVVGMARPTIHRDLPALAADYKHIIIDTPPRTGALSRSAILAADVVLIPVQPSSYDIWAAAETVELVNEAIAFKPDLKAGFIISRAIPGTVIGRDIEQALKEYDLPIIGTISQRIAIAESAAGGSVLETDPQGKASREFINLGKAILKIAEVGEW